jgi:tetratricopeptide (TPR) repeat protein
MIEKGRTFMLVRRFQAGVVAACIVLLALTTAQARASAAGLADPPVTIEQARAAFKARNYRDAIAMLDVFIAAHPRDASAFILRGDAKANLGESEAALKDYNSAIGIAPDYQYAYVTRCETRLQLDDTTGALADCDTAIRLDANDPLAYEDRGDVQFQREAYSAALADYDRAIALGRPGAYVYAARCDTNRLVGNRERAATDCDKALTLDPKSRRGLWARGRLEIVNKQYPRAIGDLTAYITQDEKHSDTAYYFRGLTYNRIESYRLALTDLQTYVGRAPTDPDGYKERAIARSGLGDKDGALADLGEAQNGYRKGGQTADVDLIGTWIAAVRAGTPIPPP